MRKLKIVLTALTICLLIFEMIFANKKKYSNNVSMNISYTFMKSEEKAEFDAYVKDVFYNIVSSCGLNPSLLTVKEGIEVVNLRNTGCFYPIYENGILTYSLEIYMVDGEFGFAFPGSSISLIKQLFDISEEKFTVFSVYDHIYGYTGNYVIDFKSGELIEPVNFSCNLPELKDYTNEIIEFLGNDCETNKTNIANP